MADKDWLLLALTREPITYNPLVVFKGPNGETAERERHAHRCVGHQEPIYVAVGENTYEEAQHALAVDAWDPPLEMMTIVTSGYHIVRAFLTAVRVLQQSGRDRMVRVYASVPRLPWWRPWKVWHAVKQFEREEQKIAEYQAKGHVASYADGLAYLQWRDGHE